MPHNTVAALVSGSPADLLAAFLPIFSRVPHTEAATSPAGLNLDDLPPIRSRHPRVPFGWPGGEPASVRRACDTEYPQKRGA